ncbi:NADP-dependent oxidoreductase [Nonomuraea sp. NPDC003201]
MRTYALYDFSEQARLTDLPVPEPGSREVRIRVRASSVNPVDAASAAGFFRAMSEYRFPAVLGRDVAGTVDRVGAEVTGFRPGDEVFGMVKREYIGDGTFAEFVVVPEDRFIVHRPEALGLTEAGAIGLAAVTALQCLDQLACVPGATVLLNGATGGVGAFIIQAAASAGLRVVATARPGAEEQHVRALGATDTVDWSGDVAADVRKRFLDGVGGVVDLVSRDPGIFRVMADLVRPGGVAVSTLGAAREGIGEGRRVSNIHSEGDPALLRRVADLAVKGVLRVPLVEVLPFKRIDEAFTLLASAPLGKVGLSLS